MKIKQLLEADLFRYQSEWVDKPGSFHMKGRTSREVSGNILDAYALAYAMEKLGVDCPRRWRSTFCTTDTLDSMFMQQMFADMAGVREVIIPKGTKVGACLDDFNGMSYGAGMIDFAMLQYFFPDEMVIINDLKLLRRGPCSDSGYRDFVDCVTQLDALETNEEFIERYGYSTLTEYIVNDWKQAIDKGHIMVFNGAESVPDGKNLEVWFEGDYDVMAKSK